MINIIVTPGAESISFLKIVPRLRERGIPTKVGVNIDPTCLNVNLRNSIFIGDEDGVMNTPHSILTASNKQGFRMLMCANLPAIAPKCFPLQNHGMLQLPPRSEFPLVVRPETHSQGRQFFVARSQTHLVGLLDRHPNLTHAIEVIYPNVEFRVFCGKRYDGSVLVWKTVEKVPTFETVGDVLRDIKPKNHSRGNAIFRFVQNFLYKDAVKEAALQAFRISGLHFGAVDVLFDTQRNLPFVIEINTRFALESETTIDSFIKYLFKYHKDWVANNA